MIRFPVGVLTTLVCVGAMALVSQRTLAVDNPKPSAMQFDWRMEGPADRCNPLCRTWISATGVVTDKSAQDFEAFAKNHAVQGATLVLDSEGGSVRASMALGRAFRRLEITTTVGKTRLLPQIGGEGPRATLSPKARCESMCAFILLGGARRHVPPEARVLVHQIWLGSKRKRALESSYTADELGLVQRDIGNLARYTVEMGGGIELLETALQVPPWEPMYALTAEEVRRMQLSTIERLFDDETPTGSLKVGQSKALPGTAPSALRANREPN